ncbi:glycosyltransferase [Streptomyces sp. NPDC051364]|uniref:glycosyltransferase n=1 Tax=Streptomyces sp. NPDC051364 TaxID=3155799 RepID=UPI0034441BF2
MSTNRSRRIDRDTAEQLLLDGARAGSVPGHDALAGLLAAVSAPAASRELSGEEEAVAVFRAARLTRAPAHVPVSASASASDPTSRRRSMLTPAMLLSAKVAAAVLAAALGGVAVAAGTGNLPAALGSGPASSGPAPSAAATAGEPGEAPPGTLARSSTAVPPDLAELCRAYAEDGGPRPAEVLAERRFAPLVAAAGGQAAVPGYCGPVLGGQGEVRDSSPTAQPTDSPRGATPAQPGRRDASRRPDSPGATRAPGAERGHPTRPPKTSPSPPRDDAPTDGAPRTAGSAATVPAAILSGGPVVEGAAGRTAGPAPRTIALTFDDGPDPVWTPKILDVLRRNQVRATFFTVGAQVSAHPELARQIIADGHQIGVHTFTHTNLGAASAWRRSLELRESRLAIAGATGVTSPLLRPPYSSTNEALNDADWATVVQAGQEGYLTVLTTQDSEDWRRPGVAEIVANSTPRGTDGQVLLMQDAGGDRSQTVAALEQLVPNLKAAGFTFATVSDAVALPTPVRPATTVDRWQGIALIDALRASDWVLEALSWLLWAAGAISVLRAVAVFVAARRHVRTRRRPWGRPVTEPVSIIVPAYNESAGIEAAVRSLLASDHPVEIIVVDDGSTDGTADIVEALHLPGVRVIRQQNAGKSAALNTGIAAASFDLLVMVDGDTVFEPDAVRMIVQPFAHRRVGALSGNAKVVNRGGLLGRWQHIEYVVGFNLDRRLFDLAECMPTVPGAAGAFRREAVLRVGGVSDTTLAEDTDLTMSLCRDGWRVV